MIKEYVKNKLTLLSDSTDSDQILEDKLFFLILEMSEVNVKPGVKSFSKFVYHSCTSNGYEYHERTCTATKPTSPNMSFRCATRTCKGSLLIDRATHHVISE